MLALFPVGYQMILDKKSILDSVLLTCRDTTTKYRGIENQQNKCGCLLMMYRVLRTTYSILLHQTKIYTALVGSG